MGVIMEIAQMILPVALVGGIGVFVIKRLKHKYNEGKLGKKKTKRAQDILDSLIPLGMLFGCTIGVIFSMILSTSLISTISLGSGVGLIIGYFAYEIYSARGSSHL